MSNLSKSDRLAPKALIARGGEDLKIISSLMQDAVIMPSDMIYDAGARRFAVMARRYMGEAGTSFWHPKGYRIRTFLHFDQVHGVQSKDIDISGDAGPLALLSMTAGSNTDDDISGSSNADTVTLTFSGGGAIKLVVDSVDAVLTDQGTPWDALTQPRHNSSPTTDTA